MARLMATESESSAPAIAATPRMFCKGCGYALAGLESRLCPECGRGFDPANRRTFARKPPRGWVWRWMRRATALLFLLMLTAFASVSMVHDVQAFGGGCGGMEHLFRCSR